jgi:hypothetical protein
VQVGASAGTSGALVPRAVINISEQEFSWLEGVGAPEIIPTQLRSEAGAPVLVGSWQTAAMALVDDTPGAEVFLHVGWRRRPAPEDVTRAFAFLEAMNIRENAIV